VFGITDVQEVYCGNTHTMAVRQDGSLWGTGNNEHGERGHEMVTNYLPSGLFEGSEGVKVADNIIRFAVVPDIINVRGVSCARDDHSHTMVVIWNTCSKCGKRLNNMYLPYNISRQLLIGMTDTNSILYQIPSDILEIIAHIYKQLSDSGGCLFGWRCCRAAP
jgi:alpha-tubulin suppressor-like RCC1 family protein